LLLSLEALSHAHPAPPRLQRSRPDILAPAYLVELEALQDRIPAFESADAFTGVGVRAWGSVCVCWVEGGEGEVTAVVTSASTNTLHSSFLPV
jgi:hypothetical protein